jgi:DNA-binding transcriptional LysR family regulator
MMKLEGIYTFVAVAEARSISEAARRLRLSKSVVSERLAELERQIGAILLHRTTRKLTLTDDGSAFLERAWRITRDVEEAVADMGERRGKLVGPLRISAPVTFGRMHLGPALYPFLLAHPDIELSLDLDDRRVDVAAGGYDAVVRHGAIADSRLMTWRLAASQRVLVASPAYLDLHGIPASIDELDRHKGIFYAHRGVADWSFATANGDMMRDAAIAGLGIALLPTFIAGTAIKDGQLQVIDVGLKAEVEYIYVAHPEGRMPSAKLRAFAGHLQSAFGNPAYWDR